MRHGMYMFIKMRICIELAVLYFCAAWLAVPAVLAGRWDAAPAPPDDPYLTNRLGRSWSEPIYAGYLIAAGRYIDAPYVVEQRGYRVLVNNTEVESLDKRLVLPPLPPEHIERDPGVPTDLSRTNTLADVAINPVTVEKEKYWNQIGLYGEDRLRAAVAYYESLPCVSKVEAGPLSESIMGGTEVILYDHNGDSNPFIVETTRIDPFRKHEDSSLHGTIMEFRRQVESELKMGQLVVVGSGGGIVSSRNGPDGTDRWKRIFEIWADPALTPEVRLAMLQDIGFISRSKTLKLAEPFYFLSSFKASDQLWPRLKGDPVWKDGAEKRLLAMTNDWERIMPAFQRQQRVEERSIKVASPQSTGTGN